TVGQAAPVSLTVAAYLGAAPLSYQWQVSTNNGAFIDLSDGPGVDGSTTSTLTLSGFATPGEPAYRVIVTDANGVSVTSNNAILVTNAAPAITTQPQDMAATVGQSGSVSFSITVSGGTADLSYQWQLSTDNGVTFTDLSDGSDLV